MNRGRVAIVGAGLQGCCAAIALAQAGWRVSLLEANAAPMGEASRWNEGKLHLGYVYANDPSLRTAAAMVEGSLSFRPILARLLERDLADLPVSSPFQYATLSDSMLSPETLAAHFAAVDALVEARGSDGYPFADGGFFRTRPVDHSGHATGRTAAVHQTAEVAVDPHWVAQRVIERVVADPAIELRLSMRVEAIGQDGERAVVTLANGGREAFDHVVNASWRSLLALERDGAPPPHRWLHRYKAAIHLSGADLASSIPSTTFALGPFGDIVDFGGGRAYLSWYPVCRLAASQALAPPPPETVLAGVSREAVLADSVAALSAIIPGVADWVRDAEAKVEGGWIFAWAETDIDHPDSRLHTRHEVGVSSRGGRHTINTGKYCMAPLHAAQLVERLNALG